MADVICPLCAGTEFDEVLLVETRHPILSWDTTGDLPRPSDYGSSEASYDNTSPAMPGAPFMCRGCENFWSARQLTEQKCPSQIKP